MKRTFIIGSEWLYYKIYSGPKTADRVLTEVIKPVTEILLDENIIDSWFFIRYADPKQHIRVRFHHKESHLQIRTIQLIHELLMPFIDTGMIWKVLTDTYNREIERYGKSLIEPTEQFLFFYDSMMVVNILDQIEGDEGEKLRWMIGLRAVNEMLEIFRFNDIEKSNFIQKLRDGFGEEFGMNKDLKSQLSDKYRNEKKSIESIMDKNNDTNSEYAPLI
ncbi:MAG: lantibiotic dehydratase, partial [Bacteroidales bacterium]|nr:lantibiotic dehydratase [Bacteroidales bacterium]